MHSGSCVKEYLPPLVHLLQHDSTWIALTITYPVPINNELEFNLELSSTARPCIPGKLVMLAMSLRLRRLAC